MAALKTNREGENVPKKSSRIFLLFCCCCTRRVDVDEQSLHKPVLPTRVENQANFEFSSSVCHSNNLKKYLIDNLIDQRLYEEYPEYLNPFAEEMESEEREAHSDLEQSTSFSDYTKQPGSLYDDYR